MLNDLIPIVLFYLMYSFAVTIVRNYNRTKLLKMLIDNNIISSGQQNIDLSSIGQFEKISGKSNILAISLAAMGFALGLVVSACAIISLTGSNAINNDEWYDIKDAIQLGSPIFLAATGLLVAYLIERKDRKSK